MTPRFFPTRWAAHILACWIVHTYAYELRNVCTYLGIESPIKRCGKTTLMTVISELVNRPEAAANISPPAFFRVIDEMRPTLFIDEADMCLPGNTQLRGILNAGYSRKMAYVLRVTNERAQNGELSDKNSKVKGSRLARFSCWGPKVIAQIGHLPETLADRCIVMRMQRKLPTDPCQRLRDLDAMPLEELRRKCARFVLDHEGAIARAKPELPLGLNDRAADICEPLFVIADLAGGDWPELVRQAAVGLTASAEQSDPTALLLGDILTLFVEAGERRLFTQTLLRRLNSLKGRPWGQSRNGKPITPRWLADRLGPHEIRPRTIWIGEKQAKGYVQEEFEDAFRRSFGPGALESLLAERRAEGGGQRTNDGGSMADGEERDEDEGSEEPGAAAA